MAHGNGGGRHGNNRGNGGRGRGGRGGGRGGGWAGGGGWNGGGYGGGCGGGGCGGGWGGCAGGCGGGCGWWWGNQCTGNWNNWNSPTIVPVPYPVMMPAATQAPPSYGPPSYGMPSPYGPYGAYGAPVTSGLSEQIAAVAPVIQDVRDSLMPALQTARDALGRIRERLYPAQPALTAPAASPFAYGPTAPVAAQQPVAACPDRSCVVYELRALDAAAGDAVRTAQVPDKTPIEVLGDTTGVIALEGATPRRWSHVRLRATDGSTIEGWMKPESLVSGAAPATSTGCACEKLGNEMGYGR